MASEILFWCADDDLSGGVLSGNLRSLIFLSASILGIVFGILCLVASGIACPWLSFSLAVSFHWLLLLPLSRWFVMALAVICVPSPPELF